MVPAETGRETKPRPSRVRQVCSDASSRAGLGMSTSVAGLCQLPDLHSPTPGTHSGVFREMEESSSECAKVHDLCEPCHHPRLRDTVPSVNLSICCELVERRAFPAVSCPLVFPYLRVCCCHQPGSRSAGRSWQVQGAAKSPTLGNGMLSGDFQEISWTEWVESTEVQKSAVSAG